MRYGIAINSKRCMACYACFMACKDEHCGWDTTVSKAQPELGQYWMNIVEWERGDNERRIKTATVPTPCSHCQDPACAELVARDLENKGMGLKDCAAKIKAYADAHRKKGTNFSYVSPKAAEGIIREFYGLPDADAQTHDLPKAAPKSDFLNLEDFL